MVKSNLPSKHFWKKKRVFITGHSSFKGTWMKLWLERLGSKIYGYSNSYPSKPKSMYKFLYSKDKINKSDNILNLKNLINKLKKFKPQIVFHLAAESIVSKSFEDPLGTFHTNIIGTANLIEACLQIESIKTIMIATTDKCYDENQNVKSFNESSILGGSEPYSISKACAELIVRSYVNKLKEKNKKIITFRAGNVVGGGDWKENRLIPDLYKSIFEEKKFMYRNLNSVRPWQHVLDCLNGYLLATEHAYSNKLGNYECWNFAPKLAYQKNVRWFVAKILKLHNVVLKLQKDKSTFYENKRLNLNSNKANKYLGWEAILVGENLIKFIDEWYSNFYKGMDIRIISNEQIDNFYSINKIKNNNL